MPVIYRKLERVSYWLPDYTHPDECRQDILLPILKTLYNCKIQIYSLNIDNLLVSTIPAFIRLVTWSCLSSKDPFSCHLVHQNDKKCIENAIKSTKAYLYQWIQQKLLLLCWRVSIRLATSPEVAMTMVPMSREVGMVTYDYGTIGRYGYLWLPTIGRYGYHWPWYHW